MAESRAAVRAAGRRLLRRGARRLRHTVSTAKPGRGAADATRAAGFVFLPGAQRESGEIDGRN